jgi:DNA polymerase zeta
MLVHTQNASITRDVHVSPAGVVFVGAHIRRGILATLVDELLATRVMIKKVMKTCRYVDKSLYDVLDARQLGLKLIANVTYGYTSAAFTGRMPCVDVADSIVHKGRETLQRAIRLIEARSEWRARVLYGDTDRHVHAFPPSV